MSHAHVAQGAGKPNLRIGVIGAAGRTGPHVLAALAEQGCSATAFIHRESQARTVRDAGAGTTSVIELQAPESLVSPLEGLDAIYVIPPVFHPEEDRLVANVVRAAERAGVQRLVLHSVLHPWTPGLPHHQRKAEAEATLRASSLAWTVLRPAMYAQTVLFYVRPDTDEVLVPYSLSAPFTVIDVYDIAQAAAIVLLQSGHEYASYDLAGAEVLTMGELVERAGRSLGRPLVPTEVPPWGFPLPPTWSRDQFATGAAMWSHYDRHGLVGHPGAARALLGREPSTLAEAIARRVPASHRAS
jgi:uncharacterized protein YbjT (DUF2867 family)